MNFYKELIIKILENSYTGRESEILKLLKSGHDLNQKDRRDLEELIDQII